MQIVRDSSLARTHQPGSWMAKGRGRGRRDFSNAFPRTREHSVTTNGISLYGRKFTRVALIYTREPLKADCPPALGRVRGIPSRSRNPPATVT